MGCFTMVQLMVAELFAGPTYGRILAIYLFVDTMISGLGVSLLGIIRDTTGSYIPAIYLMIGMCVTAFVCVLFLNKNMKQEQLKTNIS
jgi:cyanate permease